MGFSSLVAYLQEPLRQDPVGLRSRFTAAYSYMTINPANSCQTA